MTTYYLTHFPIRINSNDCDKEFKDLLRVIKPDWPTEKIKILYINKGTTNKIISASLDDYKDICDSDRENFFNNLNFDAKKFEELFQFKNNTNPDVVLVRIYGNMTEVIIDRKKEIENMVAMWSIDCGSKLYCSFQNGLCYEYAHGITVSINNVRHPKIFPIIAQTTAQMHFSFSSYSDLPIVNITPINLHEAIAQKYLARLNDKRKFGLPVSLLENRVHIENNVSIMPSGDKNDSIKLPTPCYFPTIKKWASLLLPFLQNNNDTLNSKTYTINNEKDKPNILTELPIDPWKEIEYLEETLLPLKSPVVYCHNDLLLDNIVYNPFNEKMVFIDLEYGDFNFQAFDIAHFFCEFAGIQDVDYNRFPDRKFRQNWLKIYLEEWKNILQKSIRPKDIPHKFPALDEFMKQVDTFMIAPHLYWGIWAILQSQVSEIPFDYAQFAKIRLNEYHRLKTHPEILLR